MVLAFEMMHQCPEYCSCASRESFLVKDVGFDLYGLFDESGDHG